MNKLNQWRAAKRYSAKLNLLNHIHTAIAPVLEEMKRASDLLDRCTRESMGIDAQGYSVKLAECSRMDIYTLGHLKGTESLIDADSFEFCAVAGMNKAEDATRNVATNN